MSKRFPADAPLGGTAVSPPRASTPAIPAARGGAKG